MFQIAIVTIARILQTQTVASYRVSLNAIITPSVPVQNVKKAAVTVVNETLDIPLSDINNHNEISASFEYNNRV